MPIVTLQIVDSVVTTRMIIDDKFEMISSGEYTFTSKNVHRRPWG